MQPFTTYQSFDWVRCVMAGVGVLTILLAGKIAVLRYLAWANGRSAIPPSVSVLPAVGYMSCLTCIVLDVWTHLGDPPTWRLAAYSGALSLSVVSALCVCEWRRHPFRLLARQSEE